jgi:hypothetical protein
LPQRSQRPMTLKPFATSSPEAGGSYTSSQQVAS